MGWSDKGAARASLERILAWDFERVVLAHGDCIDTDAKVVDIAEYLEQGGAHAAVPQTPCRGRSSDE
jgi:hypothetical protein